MYRRCNLKNGILRGPKAKDEHIFVCLRCGRVNEYQFADGPEGSIKEGPDWWGHCMQFSIEIHKSKLIIGNDGRVEKII